MRAILVEFFTVLVCTNVGLGKTYANDRGLSEESLHCGDSSDDFDSGDKTFQDSSSYHPKPRFDSAGGNLNLNLPSRRFDSFNSMNTQSKRSAVMVPSSGQAQLAKRQPFQRSYRFIPVREEAPSAEPLESSNPLQDLVYQQGGINLEKREINAKTRDVKNANTNNNYPAILAKFRIKSKLEKSDYLTTSSSGGLEKRNSLSKILTGSDSSSTSSSSSASASNNGLRGGLQQETGSAKSRIRRKSRDSSSSGNNNGGHIEEKLKNILDDMGLIDNTNLIDDLDGRTLKREVANKQREPIKEDSDDSSLSISEEDTNGDTNRNKRDSNNPCSSGNDGSTARNQMQWSTENPLSLLNGKNNLFSVDNIKNSDDGSLSSLRKRQTMIESPLVEQTDDDDDGTEKNSRNKREKSQGKDDLDIVESLKESGDLTFSGNKSPLASSSDINTRDDKNSKVSKAHNVGNSKNQDDYEKRVEREIQDKIETLKDEVKREIAALKETREDELDSQRKKRQTNVNLLDEESDSVNPVLNPSNEELKPLVRKRRSVSLDDQETSTNDDHKPLEVVERSADVGVSLGSGQGTASLEELKPLVVEERSADLSFSISDQKTPSNEKLKPSEVAKRSADPSASLADQETASNEELQPLIVEERSADSSDQETPSDEELEPLERKERSVDLDTSLSDTTSDELKSSERQERTASLASLGDQEKLSSEEVKSLDRHEKSTDFSAPLSEEKPAGQNLRTDRSVETTGSLKSAESGDQEIPSNEETKSVQERSADFIDLLSEETSDQGRASNEEMKFPELEKRSADSGVSMNEGSGDGKNEELKPLTHLERSADSASLSDKTDGSPNENLALSERKERSGGSSEDEELKPGSQEKASSDELKSSERRVKSTGSTSSLSEDTKAEDRSIIGDLKPLVRKRRSAALSEETSDQSRRVSDELKSTERKEKSTGPTASLGDNTENLDVSLNDEVLKPLVRKRRSAPLGGLGESAMELKSSERKGKSTDSIEDTKDQDISLNEELKPLVRKRRSSPLTEEDDGEPEVLERQTRSSDSDVSPGESVKSAERKKRSAAHFEDSLSDETEIDQEEKCPGGGGGGGSNLDSTRLKREGLGKEEKDPTGGNRRYSKNFEEEPENSFDTLGHFNSLEKRELSVPSGSGSVGDRQRRWRQGFGNQNRNAQMKKESLKQIDSEDSCSDLTDEDSSGKELKRQSMQGTDQKALGDQQNLNSAETIDDYDRIKRFNEAEQYDEDANADFYEDTADRLKRENFDDYDMHEARPAAANGALQQQPIIDEERPRYRRRISEEQDSLNRPQQLSDMSDLDLFGALPKSYDGELSRYKRVKRRRRDDGEKS